MSISINVSGMSFNRMSYAERADLVKRRKIRLSLVRKQSKDFAKHVRDKFQTEKDAQLKRIQEIKRKELENLKRLQCEKIHEEYAKSLNNFGDAHIAAINASCEENDDDVQRKEEYDLMAAQRGRTAMLQEQRRRDREAEERLAKRKRMNQKSVSIQADLVTRTEFRRSRERDSSISDYEEDESSEKYVSKVNKHKNSSYNPKNFTSNSVESSNHGESLADEDTTTPDFEDDSVDEFDQIQTLLKQRCFAFDKQIDRESKTNDEPVTISNSSSDSESELPPQKSTQKTITIRPRVSPKKQSILRKNGKSPKKLTVVKDKRVNYDFGCKSVGDNTSKTGYSPKKQMTPNKKQTAEMMRHMEEKKAEEALHKEKTRRDYENLREELDELAKQEQEAREAANKAFKNFSRVQLQQKEKVRRDKMNQAVENAMMRNILTCPPVENIDKTAKKNILNLNVANPITSSLGSEASLDLKSKPRAATGELTNLVKMERLKDLLDRINHQKKLVLREIEKSDDIPGPDLQNVLEKIKILEKEKQTLDAKSNTTKITDEQKMKEIRELQEREKKIREREQRLESRLKELFKQTQKKSELAPSTITDDASENISIPPVEIIIKVPNGKTKVKKSIRCIDTLHREPGRVYPKTPRKTKVSSSEDEKVEKLSRQNRPEELKKVEQQTQTSPAVSVSGVPKSILKKSPEVVSIRSEDSEVSTTYQSLPDRVNLDISTAQTNSRKPHHKLNPVLMHYITRLLGMKPNFQNQLNVQTSPIATPGSSTINTSGNNETNSEVPSFDEKRLKRLREFINDNYSFLSEVNETLERSKVEDENEANIQRVDGIWQNILRKKKPLSQIDQNSELEKQKKIIEAQINQQLSRPFPEKTKQADKRPKTAVAGKRTPHTIPSTKIQPRPATAQNQGQSQIAAEDMLSMTNILESHMMNNFSEYTANCQKRISELALMMEKVRQEKLKLIEHSLSSGEFNHFTEYKDIILNQKHQDNPTTSASDLKDSPSQREDPASEEINNILHKQMKLFGVSKDSGISLLSRPVTSSDFRDSPDVRVTSEEPDNSFQPILKDIPKVKPKASSNDTQSNQQQVVVDNSKKAKPPLSITRISPLLDKPHEAHELSTIAEVETPTASRVNIQDDERLKTFMNFEEYQKHLQKENSDHTDQKLDEIMSKLEDLKLKTFVGPQAYEIDEISNPSRSRTSSEASIDILEEMKKRNLYTEHIEETTPSAAIAPHNVQPASPKKPPAQSKIVLRTPENIEISIGPNTTPVKHTNQRTKPSKPVLSKSGEVSGVQEINYQQSESSGDELKIDIETSSSEGRPLNLAQFLAQELVKRSNKTVSDESSLSSQFMRSLLNAASARSTPSLSSISSDDKVRTSTPVQAKTNSSQYPSTNKTSGHALFQGDSLSTLKGSEGEKSGSSADDKSNA